MRQIKRLNIITDNQISAIDAINSGYLSVYAAAKNYGIHKTTLYRLIKNGIIKSPCGIYFENNEAYRYWENISKDYMLNNYSGREFCSKYNIGHDVFKKYLSYFNVSSNNLTYTYNYNRNIFKNIDSADKAYWIGFILADGYIKVANNSAYSMRIKLSVVDIDHLKKFCDFMQLPYDCIKTEIHALTGNELVYVALYSKDICLSLMDIGVLPNKSMKEKFIDAIPERYLHDFIRGIFDGDGCILSDFSNINFVGSYSLLESISNIISYSLDIPTHKIAEHGKIFRLAYYRNEYMYSILTVLYNNSNVFLNRKYSLYKQFCRLVE